MKYLLFTTLSLLLSIEINAQSISGYVVNEQQQPIPYANIVLVDQSDSTFKAGVVTDEDGRFAIVTDNMKYIMRISSIGHKTRYVTTIHNNMEKICLTTDSMMLSEVVVKGLVPLHKLTSEGMTTSVENTILSKMGTANDVLSHIPGLLKDGNSYIVFGKGTPLFYINRHLVHDLSELDQLKSEDIRSIELITTPGARYDASVQAVVKIRTTKPQGEGFGVSARMVFGQSENTDFISQIDVNYRHKGLDTFGMVYVSSKGGYNHSQITQDIQADTIWHQENKNDYYFRTKWVSGRAGMNYAFNDNHSIGFRYDIDQQLTTNNHGVFASIVEANSKRIDKMSNAFQLQDKANPEHATNLYYNGRLGKTSIDFNGDWKQTDHTTNGFYDELSEMQNDRTLHTSDRIKNRLFAAKLVVSHPLLGGNFTIGGEYTNTKRNDNYANQEGYLTSTNTVLKDQDIAAFAEYMRQIPIGILRAGIRYEHAMFDYYRNGRYLNEQSRSFDNIFPSISLLTKIGQVQGMIAYTAKTRRPTYSELSGNMTYANRFTLETGNPLLQPSTIHNISVKGMWKICSASIDYTDTRDAVIDWAEQMNNNTSISILTKKNVTSLKNLTALFIVAPSVGLWHPQIAGGVSKQWLTLHTNSGQIKMNAPIFLGQMNNAFQFSSSLTGDLVMKYTSKGDNKNVSLMRHQLQSDASITKTFLKGNLSLKLAAYDIFHMKQKVKLFNQQMQFVQLNSTDTRYAELTLRYKFNSGKSKYKGTGAGNDEKERL